MNYFVKLFLRFSIPMGLGVGLFSTFRWGLPVGLVSVIGTTLFSAFVVLLVKSSYERRASLIETNKFKPNVRFAQRFLLVIALLVLAAIPILFIYTDARKGVAPRDLPLVIGFFEVLFLYFFFRAFRGISKDASALYEPMRLPSVSFYIVSFFAGGIVVIVSHYNKEVALVIVLGYLLGNWIYRDCFARGRKKIMERNKQDMGSGDDSGLVLK